MYHIAYLTTNLINRKFYVGIHSTYNLNDGYIGSGKYLKLAIRKYGRHNFKCDIIYYAYDFKQLKEFEIQVVDELFIKRKDTYNCKLGGNLLTDEDRSYISTKLKGRIKSDTEKINISTSAKKRVARDGMTCNTSEKYKNMSDNMKNKKPNNYNIPCSEERKRKLKEYNKLHPRKDTDIQLQIKSERAKGNTYRLGLTNTEESKLKVSETLKQSHIKSKKNLLSLICFMLLDPSLIITFCKLHPASEFLIKK